METFLVVSAALSAIAAAAAAIFTYMQVRGNQLTMKSQLFLAFSEKYSSPEINEAIITLIDWYKEHPNDFAEIWYTQYRARNERALEIEKSRRTLNRYFVDVARLYNAKMINKEFAKMLVSQFGLSVYLKICLPMWDKLYQNKFPSYAKIIDSIRGSYGDEDILEEGFL